MALAQIFLGPLAATFDSNGDPKVQSTYFALATDGSAYAASDGSTFGVVVVAVNYGDTQSTLRTRVTTAAKARYTGVTLWTNCWIDGGLII